MITNKGKILPIAENTAMQSRDWPDRDAIVHHKNSIQTKKKIWFIISTEQREYRASAMQWTCDTYQSLSYMNMFLFKGWKWRVNGRKPKQKTSVQNLVFLSSIHIEDSTMKEHLVPQFDIFVGQSTSYTLRGYPF